MHELQMKAISHCIRKSKDKFLIKKKLYGKFHFWQKQIHRQLCAKISTSMYLNRFTHIDTNSQSVRIRNTMHYRQISAVKFNLCSKPFSIWMICLPKWSSHLMYKHPEMHRSFEIFPKLFEKPNGITYTFVDITGTETKNRQNFD